MVDVREVKGDGMQVHEAHAINVVLCDAICECYGCLGGSCDEEVFASILFRMSFRYDQPYFHKSGVPIE